MTCPESEGTRALQAGTVCFRNVLGVIRHYLMNRLRKKSLAASFIQHWINIVRENFFLIKSASKSLCFGKTCLLSRQFQANLLPSKDDELFN